jgi:hypothetical protein
MRNRSAQKKAQGFKRIDGSIEMLDEITHMMNAKKHLN